MTWLSIFVAPDGESNMAASRLNHAWRFLCTGAAFAAFSLGGAILALVFYPAIALASRDATESAKRFRALISRAFGFFVGALRRFGVISLTVDDLARLRSCRGFVIVANHPSLLDVVLIVAQVENAQCVVKPALWLHPFLGFVVRAAGYIRSDLEAEAMLEACAGALRAGDNLVIFPEGTRTVEGAKGRIRRGFSNIALFAEADVLPLVIFCDPPALKKGSPWYEIPERRVDYRIRVGARLSVKSFVGKESRALGARRLAREVESFFEGARTA